MILMVDSEVAFRRGIFLSDQGDWEGALSAWRQTVASGNSDLGPQAAVGVGVLLAMRGEVGGAADAWNLALESGHHEAAPLAAMTSGCCAPGTAVSPERRRCGSGQSTPATPVMPPGRR